MSAWPGKFVIGLTGNIATGKSIVRKMLENLGAYGIDADVLANRAIVKGSPGYQPVVEMFGKWILMPDGQIEHSKLARIVFADPAAMDQLESIVHPLVRQAIDILIRRNNHKVIVIEAIKLIESSLSAQCDALWVTFAPHELQISRLVNKRGMIEAEAIQRIDAQPLQEIKLAIADVVIQNVGSYEKTWTQVTKAWKQILPETDFLEMRREIPDAGEITVQRARPREAAEIVALMNEEGGNRRKVTLEYIMTAFSEKAFLILRVGGEAKGVVGWKVENLIACTNEVHINDKHSYFDSLQVLMDKVEGISQELLCEVSLLFLPLDFIQYEEAFDAMGYKKRDLNSLGVRAWEEAAKESLQSRSFMLFKQLRKDRILKPV